MSEYPHESDLKKIRDWDTASTESWMALMGFVENLWWMPAWGWHRLGYLFQLSTGGWSGNEDIIEALKKSRSMFWTFCWQESRRGGHYKFQVPDLMAETTTEKTPVARSEEPK